MLFTQLLKQNTLLFIGYNLRPNGILPFCIISYTSDAVVVAGKSLLRRQVWLEQMLLGDSDGLGRVLLPLFVSGNRNTPKQAQDPEGGGTGRQPAVPPASNAIVTSISQGRVSSGQSLD